MVNKKDRPLPSGRMTLERAIQLRWLLVPTSFLVSVMYSTQTLYASIGIAVLAWIYNEAGWSNHWLLKNILNAAGLSLFEIGATFVAGTTTISHSADAPLILVSPGSDRSCLNHTATLAVIISAGVMLTTIHAQDYRDAEGDLAVGRKNIAIVFPRLSRFGIFLPILGWSVALAEFWQISPFIGALLMLFGLFVGARFMVLRSIAADKKSYVWYNVCLSRPLFSFLELTSSIHRSGSQLSTCYQSTTGVLRKTLDNA